MKSENMTHSLLRARRKSYKELQMCTPEERLAELSGSLQCPCYPKTCSVIESLLKTSIYIEENMEGNKILTVTGSECRTMFSSTSLSFSMMKASMLSTVVHTYSPSSWETELGGSL